MSYQTIYKHSCLIFCILLIFIISGCKKNNDTNTAKTVIKKKLVEVIPVKTDSMPISIDFTGNLHSHKEVSVLPRIAGQVVEVYVDEGDKVSEGEIMARINDDTLRAQRSQLQANLAIAESQYAKASKSLNLNTAQIEIGIDNAQQGVHQSSFTSQQLKLSYEQAERDLNRVQNLYDKGAVAKQDLENAKLRYETARKQYAVSETAITNAKNSLQQAKNNTMQTEINGYDIAAASAQIDAIRASISILDINIRDCEIKAPFSGVISYKDKTLAKGSVVSANPSMPLFKIVDNNDLYIEGSIPENMIANVNQGDTVSIVMDAYPKQKFTGTLDRIIQSVNPQTMAATVRAKVENSEALLQQGMFGRAKINVGRAQGIAVPAYAVVQHQHVLTLPGEAQTEQSDSQKDSLCSIFVAENGKAVRKDVKVKAFNEKEYIIAEGDTSKNQIKSNARIIITSVKTLQDQEAIEVKAMAENKASSQLKDRTDQKESDSSSEKAKSPSDN